MKNFMLGIISFVLLSGVALFAQDVSGSWQGTLHAQSDLRVVLKIAKAEGGVQKATMFSIDQGAAGIAATVTLQGSTVKISVPAIGGSYEGKLDADGATIVGTWTQGDKPLPLNLKRATSETAWVIPEPPPPMKPMAP